jgi:uncharacterized membrane protein YbhN (UPF0104 family)
MTSATSESTASPSHAAKGILVLLVKLVVTLVSLYLLFRSLSLEALGQLFAHMQIRWFALAVLVFLVAQVVSALRCAYVVRTLGAKLSWVTAVRAHFVGLWFNQILPTGLGGDVVKIALIKAQAGLGVATRAVVIDRVSGLMILMFMLMIQLPFYFTHLKDAREVVWIALVSSVSFFSVIALSLLAHALQGKFITRFGLQHVMQLLSELWLFSRRRPLWEQFWTSMVVHVNGIVVFGLIGHALGVAVDPLLFLLMVPMVFLAALLPFSFAGWGLREAGAIWIFAMIGIPRESALGMSIGFGVLMLIAGLPGLLAYVMYK